MNTKLIVSHFNEDLNWLDNISIPVKIYSRTIKKYRNYNVEFIDHDLGTEAIVYLKYIIDNYAQLEDKILFVHAHRTSWHHNGNVDDIINNLDWKHDYFNINKCNILPLTSGDEETIEHHHYNRLETYGKVRRSYKLWIEEPWCDIFGDDLPLPGNLYCRGAGQFYVSKDLILNHPKEFYSRIYNWLLTTDIDKRLDMSGHTNILPCQISGRVIEAAWYYIFTGKCDEPMGKYEKI